MPDAPDAPEASAQIAPLPVKRQLGLLDAQFILAAMLTIGDVGLILAMMFVTVPASNVSLVDTTLGALTAGAVGAWGYFFGSSKSSQAKDATIAGVLANPTQGGQP